MLTIVKELTSFRDADLGYAALRNTTSVVFWLLSYQTNKVVWGSVYKTTRALLAPGRGTLGTQINLPARSSFSCSFTQTPRQSMNLLQLL